MSTKTIPKAYATPSADLKSVLGNFVQNRMKQIDTVTIGIIQTFYPETQTADILPAIKRWAQTEKADTVVFKAESQPVLTGVPVSFPSGGGWTMTFPVSAGDECILLAVQRDSSNWRTSGGEVEAESPRRSHSFKDAIAIVGINSEATALSSFNSSEPELRNESGSVKFTLGETGASINDGVFSAVSYENLATALALQDTALNAEFTKLTTTLSQMVTAFTALGYDVTDYIQGVITTDITSAQVEELKLP